MTKISTHCKKKSRVDTNKSGRMFINWQKEKQHCAKFNRRVQKVSIMDGLTERLAQRYEKVISANVIPLNPSKLENWSMFLFTSFAFLRSLSAATRHIWYIAYDVIYILHKSVFTVFFCGHTLFPHQVHVLHNKNPKFAMWQVSNDTEK